MPEPYYRIGTAKSGLEGLLYGRKKSNYVFASESPPRYFDSPVDKTFGASLVGEMGGTARSGSFDPFDRLDASGYWPGRDEPLDYESARSGYSSVAARSGEVASTMFVPRDHPYKLVQIQGFEYAVEDRNSAEDYEIALTLHELNQFAIGVISFIGCYLDAGDRGKVPAYDLDVDLNHLEILHGRLREGYSVDDIYEAFSGRDDGTSFVINNGEEIHMCVRGPQTPDKMIVLYTVLTHELAHIASSTPDHDDEFWSNYSLLRRMVAKMES